MLSHYHIHPLYELTVSSEGHSLQVLLFQPTFCNSGDQILTGGVMSYDFGVVLEPEERVAQEVAPCS